MYKGINVAKSSEKVVWIMNDLLAVDLVNIRPLITFLKKIWGIFEIDIKFPVLNKAILKLH